MIDTTENIKLGEIPAKLMPIAAQIRCRCREGIPWEKISEEFGAPVQWLQELTKSFSALENQLLTDRFKRD